MTLQELLLQRFGDEKSTCLQLYENLREIAYEPYRIGSLQDSQRSREREIPAQGNRPSNLFID